MTDMLLQPPVWEFDHAMKQAEHDALLPFHDVLPPQPAPTTSDEPANEWTHHVHPPAIEYESPRIDDVHSSPARSSASSPYSGTWLEEPEADLHGSGSAGSPSDSESTASQHSMSHASTPMTHYHHLSQAQHVYTVPVPPQQVAQPFVPMTSSALPTPASVMPKGAFGGSTDDLLRPLEGDIGMLFSPTNVAASSAVPAMPAAFDQDMVSVPSEDLTEPTVTTPRVQVSARRRTRYTTAASATSAARSAVSSRTPSGSPALETQSSFDSGMRSMDLSSHHTHSSGSAQSSEQEDQEDQDDGDFEEEEVVAPRGKQAGATKRKRGGAAASTAANKATASNNNASPPLDKRERNKLSASMYRKRRKVYLDSLEGKVGQLDETIAKQNETIARQASENKALKEQLTFLKKIIAGLKNPLGGGANAAAAMSIDESPQPTNIHHGARRGGLVQSASAFLFVLISCCLLVFGPLILEGDNEGGAVSTVGPSSAGRKLLSISEVDIATPVGLFEEVSSALDANLLATSLESLTITPTVVDQEPEEEAKNTAGEPIGGVSY